MLHAENKKRIQGGHGQRWNQVLLCRALKHPRRACFIVSGKIIWSLLAVVARTESYASSFFIVLLYQYLVLGDVFLCDLYRLVVNHRPADVSVMLRKASC